MLDEQLKIVTKIQVLSWRMTVGENCFAPFSSDYYKKGQRGFVQFSA
jgi:hypothetical protein